ncbi:hypothetical protein Hamer_G004387, partial [Homarus americanus]
AKDKQYAELLEKLDCEEVMSAAITDTEIRARRLETQRASCVLKEQIAEKAASKAKAEAEKTIAMMSEVDEVRVMNQEREEQLKKKHKSHTLSRQFLLTQSRLKQLQQEERDLDDRKLTRATEEYNLRAELKKELGRQEEEMVRLQQNQRELALVKQLEMEQQEKEVLRHTRLEVELLEKQVEERKLAEEKQRREEASRINLKNGWDSQLQYKQEQLAREQAKEEEYRKMLLEVLAEEARLDQLVSEARRRRQLDHRKSILEEEEKQLLLRHAPQLMPHFTPQLLARLRQLL